jgi:hypothetical protein
VALELPWILEQMGDTSRLRSCISNPAIFHTLCTEMAAGNYDLVRYWNLIGDTPGQIVTTYLELINQQLKVVSPVYYMIFI